MNCSNPKCREPLNSELAQFGSVRMPICFNCFTDGMILCSACGEWWQGGHDTPVDTKTCFLCLLPLTEEDMQIMADIQAVENDLKRQYMQVKLLEMSEV